MTKEEFKRQLEERVARLEEEVRRQQMNKVAEEENSKLNKNEINHES